MTAPRTGWALAYILNDWRRNRAVAKAYRAVREESPDAAALIAEALRKCEAYAAALREVVGGPATDAVRDDRARVASATASAIRDAQGERDAALASARARLDQIAALAQAEGSEFAHRVYVEATG